MSLDDIDERFQAFRAIAKEVATLDKTSWSEADTRLRIVDPILFNVLGWDRNEAIVEERAGTGFTDYTLKIRGSARAVIEAKKQATSFALGNRQSARAYKLNGPVFNAAARAAIDQAIVYSAYKNCELACATNGAEWIIFRGNRLGDGRDTLEGKGFVFASLTDIETNFRSFFDLIAKQSVESLRFRGAFQQAEGTPIRDLSYLRTPRLSHTKHLLARGEFAADFDAIMTSFFERLKGDQDVDMIYKCFVVTRESELADDKLLRIAEGLVGRLKSLDTSTGKALVDLIEAAKLQHKNRFVLLVGNKGAGKSTFIDRFFKFIIPQNVAAGLVTLRVDLARHSGDINDVIQWLNQRLLEECEKAVFTSTGPDWDECVGKMFFDDYQRWSGGTMSHLYKADRDAFKIEFGKHVEKVREDQPHEYIRRIIGYITKSNLHVPCLIFDNTDHFTIPFQESVFQYARSIYESEFCVVIVPITDKTSWQLSKHGALQSFESEALSLPVPQAEKVIERRISYLLEKLHDDDAERRRSYFLNRGIRLTMKDIGEFAAGLNRIFVESKATARTMGGLSNHDIRRLLELTKDAIASPHLKLEDLLKAHLSGRVESVPEFRVKQAIIKQRYDIYPAGEHSFVQNLFALRIEPPTTPLLAARILQFLRDAGQTEEDEDGQEFVGVNDVYEYFVAIGIHPEITNGLLMAMIEKGLILNYDPTVMELDGQSLIEASPSGKVHLSWATIDQDYLQFMKDVTPLRDRETFEQIVSSFSDYKRKWRDSIRVFIEYLLAEDEIWCKIPDHPTFAGQVSLTKRMSRIARQLEMKQS